MKIALVHDWLTGMRGGEKCLEVLCRRFPDAELYTLLHFPGRTSAAIDRMAVRTSSLQRLPGVRHYYRYLLPWMPRAIESFRLPADLDLVVSFSHAVAGRIRPPQGVPHLCYCFTPMRYAWHMRHEYVPPASGWRVDRRLATSLKHRLLDRVRQWDQAASSRVTKFIAISQTVAERIEESYGRTSEIVFPPVDCQFYTPEVGVPREDYYLCVSALVPYKRIELAITACNELGRRLLIVGDGPELQKLTSLAGPTVSLLGWRSNQEIREHLRRCQALIFPGCEDFGIVPLEAQACGAPVIALGQGGATETVLAATEQTAGTGVFFSEPTSTALIAALQWFEAHRDCCSSELARQQAERFNLLRYEQEMLAQIESVLSTPAVTRQAA